MVDHESAQDRGAFSNDPEAQGSEDPLAQYRGTSRILVILASNQDDPDLTRQRELNAQARAGFADRDLVVVEFVGTHPGTPAVREKLSPSHGAFQAFLVGKDSRVKRAWEHPIRPEELFATIDAMPMRQHEMRERRARVTSRHDR